MQKNTKAIKSSFCHFPEFLRTRVLDTDTWQVQEMEKEKWLGDWFSNGLQESVMATIKDWAPKLRRASFKIMNIVKDYRAQREDGS